jgi:gliding motility-associated-like protein
MTNRWLLPIIFFLFTFNLRGDVPVEIRRICKNAKDNYIYFYPSSDPCSLYFQYKIWGRNGLVGPYSLLDSVLVKNTDLYIHVNANPGIATNWSYFIVITDSCGPDYQTGSDTLFVDEIAPASTFIDSVSVDPITNKVNIGWSSNSTLDFSYYIVYRDSQSNNIVVSTNSKDTFMTDNRLSSNPSAQPLKYDISAVDSCGNAKIFGINPHTTMWLRQTPDSCARKTSLTWSPYVGWNQIRIYYIYKKTGAGQYILIDSVSSTQTTYTDTITLGIPYSYYIRAFKDSPAIISSSSNSSGFNTRARSEPTNSYISVISVLDPPEVVVHIFNPMQEVKKYDILAASDLNGTYSVVSTINGFPISLNYQTIIPLDPQYKYLLANAYNACDEPFPSTDTSRYIELMAISQNAQNLLSWEPYFTWNVGVDYYRIYRGTNDALGNIIYTLIDSVPGIDSSYTDSILPSIVGENGLCYYVVAVQKPGDVNGTIEFASSTRSCVIGELKVYIPNAFKPDGFNRTFRPEGSYIDYTRSEMEIYDRWGGRIIAFKDIRDGWDGKDSSGITCIQGVYYYKIYIKSTNGKEKVFNGFVTLLD